MLEVMGWNPGQIKNVSCSHHVVIFHYEKNYYNKDLYFPKNRKSHGPTASGASVDPTSQVCSSATLVTQTVQN
jgi:uncharacterized protein YvpB